MAVALMQEALQAAGQQLSSSREELRNLQNDAGKFEKDMEELLESMPDVKGHRNTATPVHQVLPSNSSSYSSQSNE